MAATKYQIFYRYINEATGNAITNTMTQDYEEKWTKKKNAIRY